ncbi:carbon-nitrogen hydrolase family protein [Pseudonocardia sp. C8]|uniref:carbon-nitrogen hydrolase family protein n=1 Tax=Pseudonocardia sp. C8 TaxID=2762759 RepID=UPI00164324EB|nr:carbon-nitrogen hydrolase family protein [Pseudonocardia sp. C8]MBC3191080.1 carbon-nitrogen hydrolase family protein [Pseudonocardia sp. C8]
MKKKLTVAAVQMDVELFDVQKNLERIDAAVGRATAEASPDLIVFPELSNIGYIKGRDKHFGARYIQAAEKVPGEFTGALGELASSSGAYIIAGMAELHPTVPATLYNTAVVIGPSGKVHGVHRKAHIPGYEKHYFVPSNTNGVIETDIGTVGVGVCYDNQFAELTRTYALRGAEILVMLWNMPSFSNDGSILHHLTSVRAFENRMFAVSCNRIGENNDIRFFGHSAIANPLGETIAAATTEDTIIHGELDQAALVEERAQMTIFRDRRPDLYSELVNPL